jgi:hypothetical protein
MALPMALMLLPLVLPIAQLMVLLLLLRTTKAATKLLKLAKRAKVSLLSRTILAVRTRAVKLLKIRGDAFMNLQWTN